MVAAWMWVRSEWRRGWSGLILLGLLIALAGGVTMAAAAGARRADTAISRFLDVTNDADVLVELRTTDPAELQVDRLPSPAELADRLAGIAGVDGVSVIDFVAARPDPDGEWFNAALGAWHGQAPAALLIAGREFDPADPYEVMVNENAAERWGGVGAELTLETLDPTQFAAMADVEPGTPAGPTIPVHVVGVLRGVEEITDVPEPIIVATPAFVERFRDRVAMFPGSVQIAASGGRVDELLPALAAAAGGEFDAHLPDEDFASRIDESVAVEVTSLWIFAVAAAIAGLVIIYQVMSRAGSVLAAERSARRALGFSRRLELLASVVRIVPSVVFGVAGAVAIAVGLSAIFPRGIARRAEPAPGVLADPVVLAVGAAAIVVGGAALAAGSAWAVRYRGVDRTAGTAVGRVCGALRPDAGLGLRLAFCGSRRARAGRAGVIAVMIAVTGFLAVTAVDRSADRLTSTPRLFGANWDAVVELDPEESPHQLIAPLRADPDVAAIGELDATGEAELDAAGPGGTAKVEPEAFVALVGSIAPTVIEGRLPVSPSEVAIGDTVGNALGADVGDMVEVQGYGKASVPFVVVGRVVNAGTNELGNGFDVTPDGLHAITAGCPHGSKDLRCQIKPEGLGISLRRGVDVDDAIARLRQIDDGFTATPIPSVVYNLQQIGATPWYLAAFLVVLGLSGLSHALATGRRLGRHDIAVTRALGLSPGQSTAALLWQAFVLAGLGTAAGGLLGLVIGRLVWRRVAEGTGALVETVVPVWAWVAAPAIAVIAALALAVGPALRLAGERPGEILRTE